MAAYTLFNRILLQFNGGIAGHALTTRFTYTVPAGQRATITSAAVLLSEINAIAAGASALAIRINGTDIIAALSINVISERSEAVGVIELQAGDVVTGITVNGGAAVNGYRMYVAIKEYV